MVRTRRKSAFAAPDSQPLFQIDWKPSAIDQTPKTLLTGNTTIIPSSLKSVLLYDWWLVKADGGGGKGLAVGGFASRERAGLRVFYSAAISKRHEATIIEATDGIIITVSGFINRSRTHENGFPPEVYNHFLLGFPFNWQDYVGFSSDEKSAFQEACTSHSDHKSANKNIEPNLDDLAVTRLQDLLLSTYGGSSHHIFMKSSNSKSSSPLASVESRLNETPASHQEENFYQDHKEVDLQRNGKNDFVRDRLRDVQEAESKMDKDFQIPSRGVSTRSMTRLENFRNKSREPLLSNFQKKRRCEENNSSCENSGRRTAQRIKSSSNVASTTNISVRADKEIDAIRDESEGRRSSLRLRNRKQNQLVIHPTSSAKIERMR